MNSSILIISMSPDLSIRAVCHMVKTYCVEY